MDSNVCKTKLQCLVYVSLVLLATADAARILAVHTVDAKSHFWYHEAILKSLVAAGHQVTMIAPFSSAEHVENFTIINSRINTSVNLSPFSIHDFKSIPWILVYFMCMPIVEHDCHHFMQLDAVQKILHSEEKLFDVMFVELLPMHECYLPIAKKFDIPIIGTLSTHSLMTAEEAVGNPRNPATIPFEMSNSGTRMAFGERAVNLLNTMTMRGLDYFVLDHKLEKFYSQYYPKIDRKSLEKVSLVFINNHDSIFPRAQVPSYINVGGIHVKLAKPKPLPEKIKKFIEESEHSTVLFSLGTLATSNTISTELRTVLRDTFAAIHQRVIWKFEEPVEGLSDNVLLVNWMPQKDILSHPNVTTFISHCGMASTYEAVYAGKPLVLLPVTFDQRANAAMLNELGVGVYSDIMTLTKEKLLTAISAVVNDTRYRDRMRGLSSAFRDDPLSPNETVVYWTEYVLRHRGASHLRTAAADLPLYQYLLLDVLAFLMVGATAFPILIYYCWRYIFADVYRKYKNFLFAKKKIT